MTEAIPQLDPPPPVRAASGYGAGWGVRYGGGLSDDQYLVMRGEEAPPEAAFVTRLWALVTLDGEPAAFISPDEVQDLDPGQPVAAFFSEPHDAYVADIGDPAEFFRGRLGRPRVTEGRVVVLSRDFADTAELRGRLVEFDGPGCAYGKILPVGTTCGEACICERAEE